jgi:DNA-binding transcriptional ArsR family regulator
MDTVSERDIREIKHRVEGIEKSVDLLVRANRKDIIADLMNFFGKSRERVKVFLEVDGERTVGQIAKVLQMEAQNVSRRITELFEEGLIKVKKITKAGKIYEKTEKVQILDLEKLLMKKFRIEKAPMGMEAEQPSNSGVIQ